MQLETQEGRDTSGDPERLSGGIGSLCGHNLEIGGGGGERSVVEIEKNGKVGG